MKSFTLLFFFSQLEKEEQIHSIDIGNEGSAFIEVLVGNSSAARDQDYEVSSLIKPLQLFHLLSIITNNDSILFARYMTSICVLGSSGYIFLHVTDGEPQWHQHEPCAFLWAQPVAEEHSTGEVGQSENSV